MINWLIEWLIEWLTDWFIDWLIDWLIDWEGTEDAVPTAPTILIITPHVLLLAI